jgi:hypothetical protein
MMARRRQLSNDDVENLEYHVFGKVKLDDALALFLFRRGTGPGPDDVPDESVLTGRYDAIAGGGALPWSLRKYHFENINASGLQSIRFPLNDSRAVGMWDLLVEILRAAPTPGELQ